MNTGMGVICEKHNPCEANRGKEGIEYEDDEYFVSAVSVYNLKQQNYNLPLWNFR